jgi:hypothetical protein
VTRVLKRTLFWLFWAFVVYYVCAHPSNAGTLVRSGFADLKSVASSLAIFLSSLQRS